MTYVPQSAEDAINNHHAAINACDPDGYLDSVHFPFTYQNYNGISITVETADAYRRDFQMPWEIIKTTEPEWSHTRLRRLEQVAQSATSSVFKYIGQRINTSGLSEFELQAIWIAVFKDGRWGVQFRHNLGSTTSPAPSAAD